jgi:outer membrane protein assembly factor BamB
MNDKVKELLDKINEDAQKNGNNIYTLMPKTNDDEIEYFKKWVEKYLKNDFHEFIDFVKIMNGSIIDGADDNMLVLYSLNQEDRYIISGTNIYENNKSWWDEDEVFEKYILFGDDDSSWYCINKEDGKYYVLFKPDGEITDSYKTFDEIIIKALEVILGIDEE